MWKNLNYVFPNGASYTTPKGSGQSGKNLFEPVCFDPLYGCPSDDLNMTVFLFPATLLTSVVAHTETPSSPSNPFHCFPTSVFPDNPTPLPNSPAQQQTSAPSSTTCLQQTSWPYTTSNVSLLSIHQDLLQCAV